MGSQCLRRRPRRGGCRGRAAQPLVHLAALDHHLVSTDHADTTLSTPLTTPNTSFDRGLLVCGRVGALGSLPPRPGLCFQAGLYLCMRKMIFESSPSSLCPLAVGIPSVLSVRGASELL